MAMKDVPDVNPRNDGLLEEVDCDLVRSYRRTKMTKTLLAAVALAAFVSSAQAGIYEPAPFESGKPIRFTEPTLGCPNVDDAENAYKQTADWAKSRGCIYLDLNTTWVSAGIGGRNFFRDSGRTTLTYGCVVPQSRWNQVNQSLQERRQIIAPPVGMVFDKECLHVVRRIDQVAARNALPGCTDPTVKETLAKVARAREITKLKDVDSNGLDGRRWCYATFSAPYPGPNGSDQEASFTLEWQGGDKGGWWLQIREQRRNSPLDGSR
jgi:hypothetical protein